MADYEFQADFAEGDVQGASYDLRPDAVVPLASSAPGPTAIGDTSHGLTYKGWYVRQDNDAGSVLVGEVDPSTSDWKDEVELFSFSGADIDMISLCFDGDGYPIVAMERAGSIWIRYRDGGSYTLTELGTGTAPALVTRAPDSGLRQTLLFYEKAGAISYRAGEEAWADEHDAGYTLLSNERLWRAILGGSGNNRLHLILSVRDPETGTYTLKRISEPDTFLDAFCLETTGEAEVIVDGADTIVIFRDDGELRTTCLVSLDAVIIAAGGDSGGGGQAEDSVLWVSEAGYGLDPESDSAPSNMRASGGGDGASTDTDGGGGGSGGGGGGQSPSTNSMWTAGGGGDPEQGFGAGGGQSTWGLLSPRRAASGGGGGYGGRGTGGTVLQGAPNVAGKGGMGAELAGWRWSGPRGGNGIFLEGDPSVTCPGGGGAGGVRLISSLLVPAGQTIPVEVGQGGQGGANAGDGGSAGGGGVTGMVAIRVRRVDLDDIDWAELSGGDESILNGYQYFRFEADDTLSVTTPGKVEILAVAGGGGGGSGCGGGGGGGDVREVEAYVAEDQDVTVGAGGAAGSAGGAGGDGGDSSVGDVVLAKGGGGGAGEPASAAGSRASGGGGDGDGGAGGAGIAMRGYPGGDGGGYSLTAGGDALSAGGGGGAGERGDRGATVETQGSELDDDWERPSSFDLIVADQQLRGNETTEQAMISKNVAAEDMFVQCRQAIATTQTLMGVIARAEHPTSDPDEAPTGIRCCYHLYYGRFYIGPSSYVGFPGGGLAKPTIIQLWAEDSVQQGSIHIEGDEAATLVRHSATIATYDGLTRSCGPYMDHSPLINRSQGLWSDFLACKSRYVEVGNMPSGGSVEVLNGDGDVVASAAEAGGTALVDLTMYGNGSTGAIEGVPIDGFPAMQAKNSGGVVVASFLGQVYPGGEFDVDGSDLTIRVDSSGSEPVPITGILIRTSYNELTPGPENGDGGDGVLANTDFDDGSGIGDSDGYLGGGGGGGAELSVAGAGGKGGAGDGSVGAGIVGAGEALTGGGGGGSGDNAHDGGAGGSGLIMVRTQIAKKLATDGLLVNHDAQALTGLALDDVIDVWPDEANGYDLGKVGSPTYDPEGINGLPGVKTSDGNYFAYADAIVSGMAAGEVMAIMYPTNTTNNGSWNFSACGAGERHPAGTRVYEGWGRSSRILVLDVWPDYIPEMTQPHLYNVQSGPGLYGVKFNLRQYYSSVGNTPSFLATPPIVGKSLDAYYFRGQWGQLVVWSRILTDFERAQAEAYFNERWALGL